MLERERERERLADQSASLRHAQSRTDLDVCLSSMRCHVGMQRSRSIHERLDSCAGALRPPVSIPHASLSRAGVRLAPRKPKSGDHLWQAFGLSHRIPHHSGKHVIRNIWLPALKSAPAPPPSGYSLRRVPTWDGKLSHDRRCHRLSGLPQDIPVVVTSSAYTQPSNMLWGNICWLPEFSHPVLGYCYRTSTADQLSDVNRNQLPTAADLI